MARHFSVWIHSPQLHGSLTCTFSRLAIGTQLSFSDKIKVSSRLYDEDAITGENAVESALPSDVMSGDWPMSLPCRAEDLTWIQESLIKLATRITARDMETTVEAAEEVTEKNITVDKDAFFRPWVPFAVVNTYTLSVTYATDKMLHSLKEIIRLSGLSLMRLT